jgi:hypothetical protein
MFDLAFAVIDAKPVPYAATPLLSFRLRITATSSDGVPHIQNILLRCQIRIEPARRQYAGQEPVQLRDLFGPRQDWGRTLHPMLWTHAGTVVSAFRGSTEFELPVPCSYDFNLAATKYFDGLESGEVPLCLLFSGTVFHEPEGGRLQIAQIPWDREANFRLPVQTWKEMMAHYYPNCAWLELRRDLFDRLRNFRSERGFTSWDQALEALLSETEAVQ